jgi:chemotaxis protein methyltransferase CheR
MTKITDKEFENLARLIVETAGIQLEKGKEYLMEARLEPILERYGLDSYNDLYRQALTEASGKLKSSIVEAITINETYFFRDNTPFDLLKNKIIPDLMDLKSQQSRGGKTSLKIWSAACSTGQEVYSIAMTLREMIPASNPIEISILGTDISSEAVARASYGKYNQFEIERGLGSYYLNKYFTQVEKGWKIKDEIRSLARFSKIDLNQPMAILGSFDIIFCRNVAIYFPKEGKIKLFQNLATVLNSGGALIVGGSESLAGLANDFIPRHYLNGVYYQLRKATQEGSVSPMPAPILTGLKPAPLPVPPPNPSKPKSSSITYKLARKKVEKAESLSQKPITIPPSVEEPNRKISVSETPEKSSLLDRLNKKTTNEAGLFPGEKKRKSNKDSLLGKLKEKAEKD